MLELYPHQAEVIRELRSGLRSGHIRQVLGMATGAGKTVCAAHIAHSAAQKGKRVLFIVDRIELVGQAVKHFAALGLQVGILRGEDTDYSETDDIVVASIQTIRSRSAPGWVDVVIIDECLDGEVRISTPNGTKKIKDVKVGDEVLNAVGVGVVQAVYKKNADRLYLVRLSDGTEIQCTGNHKFLTESGWIEAKSLGRERLVSQEDMSDLWGDICAKYQRDSPRGEEGRADHAYRQAGRGELEFTAHMFSVLCEEIEEPDARSRDRKQNEGVTKKNGPQADFARREWQRIDQIAKSHESRIRRSMGGGAYRENESEDVPGVGDAVSLQARSCESGNDDSDRDRRQFAQRRKKENRYSKNGFSRIARVESVEAIQSGSNHTVYDLQVSRHPSYFAEGVLVHNCHILHRAHVELMTEWASTPFIGLSATPLRKGLGKHFSHVIRGPSVRWLTENGFLVPVRAFAPGAETIEKVLRGVKAKTTTNGYDYDESALGEVMNRKELVGDIVSTWKEKGEDRQTLAFAVNIAHSKSLVEDFQSEGIAAAHLDAYTNAEERRNLIAAFRAAEIRILSSVNVLGIGFDVPDAACLILARPTLSEMLDMQQKGRGIRTAENKSDCIFLDHCGNTLRHGLPIHFEIPETLDDGTEDARAKNRKARELKLVHCKNCGRVLDPDELQCPSCGVDRPIRPNQVTHRDGKLVEYGSESGPAELGFGELEDWYLGFRFYAENSRGKDPDAASRYAYAATLEKFKGRKPAWVWRSKAPRPPSPQQLRWIRSRNIRWVKARSRA